jgi:hypothetical protein
MVVGGVVDGGDGRDAQTTANEVAVDGVGALVCTARGEGEEEEKDGWMVCGGEGARQRSESGGEREEGGGSTSVACEGVTERGGVAAVRTVKIQAAHIESVSGATRISTVHDPCVYRASVGPDGW